jgi:hypothetical protein
VLFRVSSTARCVHSSSLSILADGENMTYLTGNGNLLRRKILIHKSVCIYVHIYTVPTRTYRYTVHIVRTCIYVFVKLHTHTHTHTSTFMKVEIKKLWMWLLSTQACQYKTEPTKTKDLSLVQSIGTLICPFIEHKQENLRNYCHL